MISFTNVCIVVLMSVIVCQFIKGLKSVYKISYYEKRLENNGIDISEVKHMTFWQMFTS